jgi:outer membrane protein OmpA-like peptidoglycan-associated protein
MTPVDPNERLCTDWQKIKEDIYDENDRHAFLERKIIYQKPTPPAPPTVIGNPNLRVETFVIPDILFATGKADLVRASHLILDSLCFRIKNVKFDSIVVEGHTDNVGDLLMNEKLSVDRSFTVASYIQQKTGIITNIVIRGLAFSRPVADNETPSGRQLNRRVEVHLYIKE